MNIVKGGMALAALLCVSALAASGYDPPRHPLKKARVTAPAKHKPTKKTAVKSPNKQVGEKKMGIDDATKQRIDRWIKDKNRNQYGDPKDTMYTGGTPLFNERTGETKDRYAYILEKHPELRKP